MQINKTFTVVAGTPIQVETNDKVLADTILIQMMVGGSGVGYVMDGILAGRTPSASNDYDLSAQLAPASPTAPGGTWTKENWRHGIRVSQIWVDGATSGDKIKVSYDQQV